MSDDLVKQLREDQPVTQDMGSTMQCSLQDAAADRIEELEAKLATKEKLVLDLAGDKIDLVSELAGVKGKLAKAVKLAEEAFEFNIEDDGPRAWHSINDRIAELKGQDDE